jgi:zinc protease
MCLSYLSQCIEIEAVEILREEMSGVYSPMANLEYSKYPVSQYGGFCLMSCDPDNADTLTGAFHQILKRFATTGPKVETFQKAKETLIRQYETNLKMNSYWAGSMLNKLTQGESLEDIMTFQKRVEETTMEDLIQMMQQYFELDNYLKVVMYPDEKE